MPLDHEHIIGDIAAHLQTATTAKQACQVAMSTLAGYTSATIGVLLRGKDRLNVVAATGSWHVFSGLPLGTGVIGRVYTTGRTETVTQVGDDPDYLPLVPDVAVEVCAPVMDSAGRPIGVLNVEWATPVDPDRWQATVTRIADLLGERIGQLGGLPAESDTEKLLRHAIALTEASSRRALIAAAIEAARDVSGLAAAVVLLSIRHGIVVYRPTEPPGELESRIRARLDAADQDKLAHLMSLSHRQGASYTLGEVGHPPLAGFDIVVEAGARTLIAVPVGPVHGGGLLLVADERLLRPDPDTVTLLELLATQAWLCVDRLHSLAELQRQAISDPLTGLRHHGPFGERIRTTTPGRTALLAIDVDDFKKINDTYGHQAGDRVLVRLARTLEAALRQGDELYRTGGDEFVAIVEVNRPEEALGIAERLATAARRAGQTISVGVAMQHDGESAKQTLRRADSALYDVKRAGRNGVRLAAD